MTSSELEPATFRLVAQWFVLNLGGKFLSIFKCSLWIRFVEADDTDGTSEKERMDEGAGWPVFVLGRLTDRAVVGSSLDFRHVFLIMVLGVGLFLRYSGQDVLEEEESNLQASALPREVD
jgi:hypothetical protein